MIHTIQSQTTTDSATEIAETKPVIPFDEFPRNLDGSQALRIAGPDAKGALVWTVTTDE